jgi:thiol-disulfide isomerase/thioredoxin
VTNEIYLLDRKEVAMSRLARAVTLLTLIFPSANLFAEEKSVDAAELVRRINANEFKIHDFDSVSIRMEYTVTRSHELIERRREEYRRLFPNFVLDEKRFSELRPISTGEIELAYDRNRLRFCCLDKDTHLDLRIWDGETGVVLDKYFNHPQEEGGYVGCDGWVNSGSYIANEALPWNMVGNHVFWWKRWRSHLYRASPNDFEIVKEDECGGKSCYVVANVWSTPNSTLQLHYWIGKEDGRLYGSNIRMDVEPIRSRLNDLSGGRLEKGGFQDWYESMDPNEQEQFNKSVFYSTTNLKALHPQTFFDDYREVHPGFFLPHLIRRISYSFGLDSIEPTTSDSITVEKLYRITRTEWNRPLSNDLFVLKFEEGIDFTDERMTPTLYYKYKENMTAEDLEKALAAQREDDDFLDSVKQESKQAIGNPASEFRKISVWFNHAPMSFKSDLKGKVVVLNFWDVNCAPCKNDMKFLADWQRSNPKSDLKIIGIHSSIKPREDIQRILDAVQVKYPVCTDFYAPWEERPYRGYLSKHYSRRYLPFTVVIDADGKIVNAGSLHEVFPKALNLQHQLEQKLAKDDGPKDRS